MGSRLDDGIFFFNAGRYFEAHEVWEDIWRDDRSDLRLFFQGLIQAAVGLHHLAHNNRIGARAQLTKSLSKLDRYPAGTAGIDTGQLQQDLRKVLDNMEVESTPAVRIARLKSGHVVVQSDGTF